jgi:hypothetical protein
MTRTVWAPVDIKEKNNESKMGRRGKGRAQKHRGMGYFA